MNHDDLPPGVTAPGYPVVNFHDKSHAARNATIIAGIGGAIEGVRTYRMTGDPHAAVKTGASTGSMIWIVGFLGAGAFFGAVNTVLCLAAGEAGGAFGSFVFTALMIVLCVLLYRANNRYLIRIRTEAWLRSLPPPAPPQPPYPYIETTGVDVTKNWS